MPCLGELLALLLTVLAAAQAADCHSASAVRYEPRNFLGYACEDDCQRHKAGFAWAERHRVTDAAACVHLESAETEGCRAFAEQSLTPEQAGYRWALENEVVDPCLCGGAGERFRAGCRHQLPGPPPKKYLRAHW